ncbi:genomic island protein [Comamonas aquatica]|uniref:portal protein n=1 Tax=Comamonas aquatica TaxID=225991 RepID=UPI002446F0E8|nr:genomic island protein [Comamonas aquatica]MDH1675829.1 genomic island protein [Comamonas aquatica]MDH1679499.1 genomic island protein [Comamonas aquatica]
MSNPKARANWDRWQYGKNRGHIDYMKQADRCEQMYLGGGRQWRAEDRAFVEGQKRPALEFNEIKGAVNTAIGYQIQNRMDIAFKPRGGEADLATATILSKVAMQVADQCGLHWKETQVFSDGLIQQRGYFDVRMNFDQNIHGEIQVDTLDPLDVMPDPDAKTYDPKGWSDVTISRWLTLDEIENRYGKKARKIADESGDAGYDFGDAGDDGPERNKFGAGGVAGVAEAFSSQAEGPHRFRVIDRQIRVYKLTKCVVFPDTGDVRPVDQLSAESLEDALAKGAVETKRMQHRIEWVVSTCTSVLHDATSPYDDFTVVPYFAYFRRGLTVGMVDDAIGPQEALNKAVSQFVHILNTSANSGWITEENSITNMDSGELEQRGATTGLHIEVKKGAKPPQKIKPNEVPTGVDRLIDRADKAIRDATVPDVLRGSAGPEVAGVAIQSRQFAGQQQLAVPLDNLAYTRRLLARRILALIQTFYDAHRIFRITETNPYTGKQEVETVEINQYDGATGGYFNDVTVGTYDVVITEQPMQVTFHNSQFNQALEMRKAGIRISDAMVVRYSNLQDKHEILQGLQPAPQESNPVDAARAALLQAQANRTAKEADRTEAQTRKIDAEATNKQVETQYSAVQTGQVIAANPAVSGLADGLLRSANFKDHDAAPIVPEVDANAALSVPANVPTNTNPLTPANPSVGMNRGIRTPDADGVQP